MRFSAYIPRTRQMLALLCQTPKMKVHLVNTWQQKAPHVSAVNNKAYSTKRYCKLIGLNTSSHYAIKARQALPIVIKPEQITLKATFMASGKTYGSRRLVKAMHHQGFNMGRYRVRSMMKSAQLVPVWECKFIRTTDSRHTGRIAANLLQQDFSVSRKNAVWWPTLPIFVPKVAGFTWLQ